MFVMYDKIYQIQIISKLLKEQLTGLNMHKERKLVLTFNTKEKEYKMKENMIDKKELAKQLKNFNHFIVSKVSTLTIRGRRGIYQTSVYHTCDLHWKDSVFKFQNKYDEDVVLYVDSNIHTLNWNGNKLTLHIPDCLESVDIMCSNN